MRSIKFITPDNGREVIISCTVIVRDSETGNITVNQGGKYINGKDIVMIDDNGEMSLVEPEKKKGNRNAKNK